MHLSEKKLSSELIYDGKIISVTRDTVLLENDSTVARELIHHHGGVCVIAINDDDEILLVRQFRYGAGQVTLEIPAGKLNEGEDHFECGLRELLEETGAVPKEYSFMGSMNPIPAYCTETVYMYKASGLEFREQNLDDDEFLDVVKVPLDKAVEMVMNNEIVHAVTQVAILRLWKLRNS